MIRPTREERIKYSVDYPEDTEFSAYARLLQSKWRIKMGFPEFKLGNSLDIEFAKTTKANFLTEKIQLLVSQEILKAKKEGGLIREPRIWNNLLSSQPLCFNLFGEMHYDNKLATEFFKKLFPERVKIVKNILFEYSAGRGKIKYTGDRSAFDIFVEYTSNEDKKCFIGIEVKYAESLKEESPKKAYENFNNHEKEYKRLTNCKVFKPNAIEFLKQVPLSQIWRDHLLALAHLQDYDEGFFVFLFPSKNSQCQKGVENYKEYLISNDEKQSGFYPRHLEDFINVLCEIETLDWAKELRFRYLGN